MKKGVMGLMLVAFTLSACQEKSLYDPNYDSDLGVSVPTNFAWSTTKSLSVEVGVNDEYNGKYYYAVRVYDKAPGEGVLPIAASSKVNKNVPFSQKIVVPATVSKLYIAQVFKNADASENVITREVAVSGENIFYSFGDKSRSISSTRAKDEAIELKEGVTFKSQGNYYLDGEYTIADIDAKVKNVTITVNGTLNFSKSATLPNQWTINVKDGGKLNAYDGTVITWGNGCVLSNYGEVHVYDVDFIQGSTLYNGDAMDGENEGACFYANTIYLQGGHGGDKRYLGERSYTSCKKLELNNVKLTMKTSAWLKCDVLETSSENGKGASTLMGEGNLIQNSNYVALAVIGEIINNLTIEDNVLVECANVTGNITGKVVPDASGLITIIGTACSEGGFGNEEEISLGDYTYLIEDMYPEKGDYDMNDIVVSLKATQTGTNVNVSGELKAVGAIRKIVPYIKIGNDVKPLLGEEAQEAHVALAGGEATSYPINTETEGASFPAKTFALQFDNVSKELNLDDLDFYIVVDGNSEIHWNTREENTTWGIRVPGSDFKWPKERVSISAAYPEFAKWFEDSSYPWYNTYDSAKTY